MKALLAACVYLFFRLLYGRISYPCALVHWYSMSNNPNPDTGLWAVQPELTHQGMCHLSVIHVDSIVCGMHLLPKFLSDAPIYWEINYTNVLDLYTSYYVNKFINHHAFEIAFDVPLSVTLLLMSPI